MERRVLTRGWHDKVRYALLESISDRSWQRLGEGGRAGSRKTKTREGSATPVQVRAGEPLVVGSGHGEALNSRDIQEVDATRLGNQIDFGVRAKVRDKAQVSSLSNRTNDSISH